jgi:predicted phage terminase large subunit-like protein
VASKAQKVQLHPAQQAFCESKALYRAFVGGRGAGKSFAGALDMGMRAQKKRGYYMVLAPTYPMLESASLRSFRQVVQPLGIVKRITRGARPTAFMTNGSEIAFRTADDPERLRGPNLSGVWLDEGSEMLRAVFDIVIACLREGGEQGWLSATLTPKGRLHWSFDVFGQGGPDVELFHAKTTDNPFNPPGFADRIGRKYTSTFAAQELCGLFVDTEGVLFSRSWFGIMDELPPNARIQWVRFWDLAATEPKKGSDPDYAVGLLMGRLRDTYIVGDVCRLRAKPAGVEDAVRACAEMDGRAVPIWIEQEPGSGGVFVISTFVRLLAGWTVRGERSTGEKFTRAQPLAAQAEAGNVVLLRGEWNRAFLDEVEMFPHGGHDDQVDAASGAFAKITARSASACPRGPGAVGGIGQGIRCKLGASAGPFPRSRVASAISPIGSVRPAKGHQLGSPEWVARFQQTALQVASERN